MGRSEVGNLEIMLMQVTFCTIILQYLLNGMTEDHGKFESVVCRGTIRGRSYVGCLTKKLSQGASKVLSDSPGLVV